MRIEEYPVDDVSHGRGQDESCYGVRHFIRAQRHVNRPRNIVSSTVTMYSKFSTTTTCMIIHTAKMIDKKQKANPTQSQFLPVLPHRVVPCKTVCAVVSGRPQINREWCPQSDAVPHHLLDARVTVLTQVYTKATPSAMHSTQSTCYPNTILIHNRQRQE